MIFDLAGVTFRAASGLSMPVGAHRRTGPTGTVPVPAGPCRQPDKILRITGVRRAFTVQ
ncbi:hypothetical protein ACQP1W_17520 [Spirillospora sp. CA-255316]